jgi:cell wall assembly regulator SMI1
MPISENEVREIVARLEHELIEEAKRRNYAPPKLRPHPPATPTEIAQYEAYLQIALPRSYRIFLGLYNGYDALAYGGDMLSIQDVMPSGKWYLKIQKWKKLCADYGSGEVLDGIVIASSLQPNQFVYLNPDKPANGDELTIVEWMGDSYREFPDLMKFFEEVIIVCRLDLAT